MPSDVQAVFRATIKHRPAGYAEAASYVFQIKSKTYRNAASELVTTHMPQGVMSMLPC